MARAGFITMGIVDYEFEDNTSEKSLIDYVDEFPELNIYEKIQIILFLNKYIRDISPEIYSYPVLSLDDNRTKPIPIPKKK